MGARDEHGAEKGSLRKHWTAVRAFPRSLRSGFWSYLRCTIITGTSDKCRNQRRTLRTTLILTPTLSPTPTLPRPLLQGRTPALPLPFLLSRTPAQTAAPTAAWLWPASICQTPVELGATHLPAPCTAPLQVSLTTVCRSLPSTPLCRRDGRVWQADGLGSQPVVPAPLSPWGRGAGSRRMSFKQRAWGKRPPCAQQGCPADVRD